MYLKLSNLLESLAFRFKQKSLYFELKHYLKNNESYLKKIHYWERAIGKTYTLVKLAHKFKCPIVVSSQTTRLYIKRMCRDLNINNVEIICPKESIIGKKYDKILCEEGINIEFINNEIKPICKTLVGFVCVDDLYYKNNFPQEYECSWIK
jgi:hypothetical protein